MLLTDEALHRRHQKWLTMERDGEMGDAVDSKVAEGRVEARWRWFEEERVWEAMSKLFSKIANFFSSRTLVGVDKAGNRYFTMKEEIDGFAKEKRWVIFKREDDPTSLPVEWICWLNGQRKKAPTPQEMLELEVMRERVRINVELLKKEEVERKSKGGNIQQSKSTGKIQSPDLKSFIQQFPGASFNEKGGSGSEDLSDATGDKVRSSEPTGSGESFKPGAWQPPS